MGCRVERRIIKVSIGDEDCLLLQATVRTSESFENEDTSCEHGEMNEMWSGIVM